MIVKRKLKKKVKITLLVICIFIILLIAILILVVPDKNETKEKIIENVVEKSSNKDSFTKKCKKLDYCDISKKERYENYQKKNTELSFEDVITHVNLNLDYSFYTQTKETPALNKEYILVNKYLYLSNNYVPDNLESIPTSYARSGMKLVSSAKDKFVKMAKAAKDDGYNVIAMSSYRSYDYQVNLYNNYVKEEGVEAADTYSARAGFSEHQTGLCVDVYDGDLPYTSFEQSPSFNWMKENAYKYGFILRFPKGKENITGYQYESWHYRYVGIDIATYIHKHNITFDEYYVRFIEPKLEK